MVSDSKSFSRRDFLSTSGKAAAGLAATGVLASCQEMQTTPIKQSRVIGTKDTALFDRRGLHLLAGGQDAGRSQSGRGLTTG